MSQLAGLHSYQTLQVYHYYRFTLSGLLLASFYAGISENVLGAKSNDLFFYGSWAYFLFTCASFFVFPAHILKSSTTRITLLLISDVAFVLMLVHASGGVQSGLSYLLIVATAMSSFFLRGQRIYAFAAIVCIAILGDTIVLHHREPSFYRILFSAGVLGLLVFMAAASLAYFITKLQLKSEEADDQLRRIKNLQEIAQNIVTRMQTGVIVVNGELQIELINEAAKQMLDVPSRRTLYGRYLADLRELLPLLKSWEETLGSARATVIKLRPGVEIRANVAELDTGDTQKYIFYLEDYLAITQHAQQLKLASLGRLAASIAHEIRNPLGAIAHAAQLLAESEKLTKADARLSDIIVSNSRRVNEIVENTLALSRRREPRPQLLELATWLPEFIEHSQTQYSDQIELRLKSKALRVRFDPAHLSQILSNLIENAVRFSRKSASKPEVIVEAGLIESDERVYIEVRDNGEGINPDDLAHIYEPFFTRDERGSGLGLYISRELAEINHASMHYYRSAEHMSCFRLNLSHYQRMR